MNFLIYMNIVMFFSGGTTFAIMNSRKYLESKDYSNLYIEEKKKFNKKTMLLQILALYGAQAIATYLVLKKYGELNQSLVMTFIVPAGILFLLPVSIALSVSFNKKYKELAQATGESVVIDFDFKVLRKIFDLRFEVPFTIIILAISFLTLRSSEFMTMLFSTLVPWVFFLVLRFAKSMNKASYKESYQHAITFSRVYLILLPIVYLVFFLENMDSLMSWKFLLAIINMALFAYKFVTCFIKFPGISKEISEL